MGIVDLNKKYDLNEIIKGDSIFCATAITNTIGMKGVQKENNNRYITETLVTCTNTKNKYLNIEEREIVFDDFE